MAGIRLPPEDTDISPARPSATADLISDDDRSVAADSWSIKSDYGSTLDDDQRHADAGEALSAGVNIAASDYRLPLVVNLQKNHFIWLFCFVDEKAYARKLF